MIKHILSYLAPLVFTLVIGGCINNTTEPPEVETNDPNAPKCVGLWKTELPFKRYTHYDVLLDVDIKTKPDTTYSMIGLKKETKDTVIAQFGFWELNETKDTVFLDGTDCRIIDTSTNKIVTRDCSRIPVFIDITNNEWTISLADLLPLASQMNIAIPSNLIPTIKEIPVILEKQ